MRYQDGWKDKPPDAVDADNQRNLEATIHRSVELGINHIETARGYGCSERQLGLVLPKFPREKLIVQTKIGPNDDPAVFTQQFEQSLERLQIEHVDLLAIHGINDENTLDQSIRPGGCFEAAQRIREQGKANFIGFSTHGPCDVITRAIEHGEPRTGAGFDYLNLHWYYIFQHNWPAIEAATKRDMGVFIISPTDKGGKLYAPPTTLVDLCEPISPIVFNDLWCLRHEQVHTLSLGAARPDDFDEHVCAVTMMNEADALVPRIAAKLEAAWDAVAPAPLRWPFDCGLPDHRQAPGGVNVPLIIWLGLLARAYGMTEYGRMRYNLLGNAGHWFPGQNVDKLEEDKNEAKLREMVADHPAGPDTIIGLLHETRDLLKGEEVKRLSQSE
jgi:hypothetical protein